MHLTRRVEVVCIVPTSMQIYYSQQRISATMLCNESVLCYVYRVYKRTKQYLMSLLPGVGFETALYKVVFKLSSQVSSWLVELAFRASSLFEVLCPIWSVPSQKSVHWFYWSQFHLNDESTSECGLSVLLYDLIQHCFLDYDSDNCPLTSEQLPCLLTIFVSFAKSVIRQQIVSAVWRSFSPFQQLWITCTCCFCFHSQSVCWLSE